MKTIKFECRRCHGLLESDLTLAGTTERCPVCGAPVRVPSVRRRQIRLPQGPVASGLRSASQVGRPAARFPALLVALLLLAGGTVMFASRGCDGLPTFRRPTKEQWRGKLETTKLSYRIGLHGSPANHPQYGGDCTRADFVSAMGEPDRTQTMGDNVFWYYDCRDGVIQVVLESSWLDQGIVSAERMNDY